MSIYQSVSESICPSVCLLIVEHLSMILQQQWGIECKSIAICMTSSKTIEAGVLCRPALRETTLGETPFFDESSFSLCWSTENPYASIILGLAENLQSSKCVLTAAMEGFFSPGVGWVTSAPMTITGSLNMAGTLEEMWHIIVEV